MKPIWFVVLAIVAAHLLRPREAAAAGLGTSAIRAAPVTSTNFARDLGVPPAPEPEPLIKTPRTDEDGAYPRWLRKPEDRESRPVVYVPFSDDPMSRPRVTVERPPP